MILISYTQVNEYTSTHTYIYIHTHTCVHALLLYRRTTEFNGVHLRL